MSAENLAAYLQDHAAGASAALDLLDHLISSHTDTPDADFFKRLRAEVKEDIATLDGILGRLNARESAVLNTMSRLGEKLARARFLLAGPGHGDLGRLEALEMLSLGLEGKHVLWLALDAAAVEEARGIDLPAMARRATAQRAQVEIRRLTAARSTLATTAPAGSH